MGYLLKEVLKTLCGVNQWSYAIFWKIGCQNPKLLIWEEYYHEPASYSGPQAFAGNDTLENALHKYNAQVNDKVHLLVNRMMLNNHVIVVGEGLVGRVAFTGNHQWILSETFYGQTHPPEVQKDVCQQFSDGMQTVAVVPVLPHGVVQFGSFLKIMENIGFVNQVTSLIVHLGYVSGVFQSEDYATKGLVPRIGALSLGSSFAATPCSLDGLNCFARTSVQQSQTSFPTARGVPNVLQVDGASFQTSSSTSSRRRGNDRDVEISGEVEVDCFPSMVKADVIPINSVLWKKQHAGCDVPSSGAFIPNNGDVRFREEEMLLETGGHGPFSIPKFSSGFTPTTIFEGHISPGINKHDGAYSQPESGDDLIDVLGADFKNKLISGCWNSSTSHESTAASMKGLGNSFPAKQIVDSVVLHSTETDHLLDAMVSKVQVSAKSSILDCVASCQSTSTNVSSSSASDTSLPYNRLIAVSENSKDELFGVPKYVIKTESEKSESVSTGYDKKPDETTKTTRKRLRPGENPRPRPKDRQMIQDRVKELREIVPNAAKCSIDSLLERTIKHMIFLQSVTKHADKLNQTGGESKIICKDGGFLLKDNLGGGATWAYEVGSQSMVCPIIVEDLHQPRQMLVEMLCEERGWFLEIADVIRGLGLTILKGIMETRNDKIWARFAVEANRDITRMEIFISLVHILEQGATTGFTQPNDIGSKNIVAKQLQPVASVPSCGKSYCLH